MTLEKLTANSSMRVLVAASGLLGASLVTLVARATTQMFTTFWPSFASTTLGVRSGEVGILLLISAAATVLGAPLLGLLADKVGRRKMSLLGILVLGLAISTSGLVATGPLLRVVHIGVALGTALLFSSLVARMFADAGSHWVLASAATLYIGVTRLAMGASVLPYMLVERIGVKNGMMVAGLILLAGGGVGMGFVGLAYLVGRSYAWPDKWLTPHGGKVQRLSLALVLSSLLFASWASGSISSSLPFFVTEKLGLQSSQVTLVYIASSPVLLLAVPVAFIVGPLADFLDWLTLRFVRRRLGRWAFAALGVLGLCGGLGILLSARDVRMLAAAVSVTGLGTAILSPPLLALVATSMPPRLWGTAIGLYLAVDVLALPLGVSVSGMAASRFGPQSPFVIALVVAVLAVLIILMGCWASRNSGKPTT